MSYLEVLDLAFAEKVTVAWTESDVQSESLSFTNSLPDTAQTLLGIDFAFPAWGLMPSDSKFSKFSYFWFCKAPLRNFEITRKLRVIFKFAQQPCLRSSANVVPAENIPYTEGRVQFQCFALRFSLSLRHIIVQWYFTMIGLATHDS